MQPLRHRRQPVSKALALPVFVFAAGVDLRPAALAEAATSWPARGVALGKPVGVLLATVSSSG